MGVLRQIGEYLYLVKRDPNRVVSKWEGYMHGMNRISICMFLVALVIVIIKLLK